MPPILGVSFGGQVLGLIRAIPVFSGRNRRDNVADYFSFPGNPRGRLMLGNAFHIVYSIKDSNNDARFFYLRHVFLPFHLAVIVYGLITLQRHYFLLSFFCFGGQFVLGVRSLKLAFCTTFSTNCPGRGLYQDEASSGNRRVFSYRTSRPILCLPKARQEIHELFSISQRDLPRGPSGGPR